mmetsp:Transcript_11256/g.23881  ORF Transcript_11256/g.23881 Transcript_11256/m.23881 type:complete len:283 (-) Transcript_11256:688-1536(-)
MAQNLISFQSTLAHLLRTRSAVQYSTIDVPYGIARYVTIQYVSTLPRVGPIHGFSETVHDLEMSVRILQVIGNLVPPGPAAAVGGLDLRLQLLGGRQTQHVGIAGGYRLHTQQFRYLGAGNQSAQRFAGRGQLFLHIAHPFEQGLFLLLVGVEAPVANAAELVGVHSCFLGNGVDLCHGFWFQCLGATVYKGTVVGILAGFAVVVDEFELGLPGFVFSNDVPVFPEFEPKHFSLRMCRSRITSLVLFSLVENHIRTSTSLGIRTEVVKDHDLVGVVFVKSNR